MNRSENEQLTDVLIGEAVLFLLQSKKPVTTRALVSRLRNRLSVETDVQRRVLLERVIAEISAHEKEVKRQKTVDKAQHRNADNVLALFDAKHRPGTSRKH